MTEFLRRQAEHFGREPVDPLTELPLLVAGIRPLERAAIVVAGVASELSRQLAVGGHPGRVEPMVDVGLFSDRVQPGERRAARPAAGRSGVERQHARPCPRGRVDGRRAHHAQSDDGDVVMFHPRPPARD